jgi:putative membrane protein
MLDKLKKQIIKYIKKAEEGYENNWLYLLITKPQLYFSKLFFRTIILGGITLGLNYLYIHSIYHNEKVPSTMHGLMGIVIGLLLVFRLNSAYDRWFEARKHIEKMSTNVNFFFQKIRTIGDEDIVNDIKKGLIEFVDIFQELIMNLSLVESNKIRLKINTAVFNILNILRSGENNKTISEKDSALLEKLLNDILSSNDSCERIKDTPIPFSYSMHIKISIFLYLITLPMGVFYDYGIWATLYVMIMFYVMSGVEMLSDEIENPFRGDPNDLPVKDYVDEIKKSLNYK